MVKPRRVCWDSCAWIATILQEKATVKGGGIEDRAKLCNHIIGLAQKKQIEIATSGLALAEVCRDAKVKGHDRDVLEDFFRNEYILIIPVDRYIGTRAREIMQDLARQHPGLKPPDAVHLATAAMYDMPELHTFDSKLLNMNHKVKTAAGGLLKICKPPAPPPSLI